MGQGNRHLWMTIAFYIINYSVSRTVFQVSESKCFAISVPSIFYLHLLLHVVWRMLGLWWIDSLEEPVPDFITVYEHLFKVDLAFQTLTETDPFIRARAMGAFSSDLKFKSLHVGFLYNLWMGSWKDIDRTTTVFHYGL